MNNFKTKNKQKIIATYFYKGKRFKNRKNIFLYKKFSIIIKYLFIILFSLLIIFLFLQKNIYAASPSFVKTTHDAFQKIEKYLIRVSTPIAAVSIGVGFLMRKFSFGDEEKIRTAKKVIRSTLVSYALILCTDLILSFIKTILS